MKQKKTSALKLSQINKINVLACAWSECFVIASLKRRGLYEVSIGLGKESYQNENYWLNDGDRYFGEICLALSPSLRYLIGSAEYPKDLWTKLDKNFVKHNEDHNITLERTPITTIILDPKVSASTLSNQVVQNEEEA